MDPSTRWHEFKQTAQRFFSRQKRQTTAQVFCFSFTWFAVCDCFLSSGQSPSYPAHVGSIACRALFFTAFSLLSIRLKPKQPSPDPAGG